MKALPNAGAALTDAADILGHDDVSACRSMGCVVLDAATLFTVVMIAPSDTLLNGPPM
jgi:hypothetical protein